MSVIRMLPLWTRVRVHFRGRGREGRWGALARWLWWPSYVFRLETRWMVRGEVRYARVTGLLRLAVQQCKYDHEHESIYSMLPQSLQTQYSG